MSPDSSAPSARTPRRAPPAHPGLRRFLFVFVATALVTLLVRLFLLGVFVVPSASMAPTLLVGDRILVDRTAYGLRLPLVGVLSASEPARGDVVVFEAGEGDGRAAYVKRVLGLPFETVSLVDKQVWVDGEPVRRERVGEVRLDADGERRPDPGFGLDRALWVERDGARTWEVATHKAVLARAEGPFVVPAGHVFVLGDDRDVSEDSRTSGGYGMVALADVQGRAVRVLFSTGTHRGLRRERLLHPIR